MPKRFFWLTSDNLIDVDIPIVESLSHQFDIDWHIFVSHQARNFTYDRIVDATRHITSVKKHIFQSQHRFRSHKTLKKYIDYAKTIKRGNYDIVYVDMLGEPYLFVVFKLFGINNVIFACHDFIEHINFPNARYIAIYKRFIFKTFKNFQFFSGTQHRLFLKKYPNKNSFMAPLCLKDFGKSAAEPPSDKVAFTFFGHIRDNKGLRLLIEAGNILADKGRHGFIINICGHSDEWDSKYAGAIRHPEVFNLNIRHAPNEEIPHIICSSHYLVFPYLDVTQSGPLLISYNYNVPAIASDHEGFREIIEHGNTGFLFRDNDPTNLAEIMEHAIDNHDNYQSMRKRLAEYIDRNLSTEKIAAQYRDFFTFLTIHYNK